jgi:hypothetical protein
MQLNSIYLYPNKITIYTSSSWTNERFRRVYNRNLKIYRSTDNIIEFQVRNGDQKPASISNSTLVFNLFSNEDGQLILRKDCETLSNNQGRARIILSEQEMNDIAKGFYGYSIIQESRSADSTGYIVTEKRPLYIDEQYGAFSTVEVVGDVEGTLAPTIDVREFSYVNPIALGESEERIFTSSIINAYPETTNPQTLHTFQIYFSDFEGSVIIQGSMDQHGTPTNWIDIPDTHISPGSNNFSPDGKSVIYKNVQGKYNWFRLRQTGHRGVLASFVINSDPLNPENYLVGLQKIGTGYSVGESIQISGRRLGGSTPANDLYITVTEITISGAIVSFTYTGTAALNPNFRTYVLEPFVPAKGSIDRILYR